MPIDYKKYPANWKTEIRPAILQRANNRCEKCNIQNGIIVIRGERNGVECYQDENGVIFDANTSERIGDDYVGEVHPTNKCIKIVLTVAHLDHDINNNDFSNLSARCQRCHNRHDKHYRKANRKKNKKQIELDL
jgi:hypothetical protein